MLLADVSSAWADIIVWISATCGERRSTDLNARVRALYGMEGASGHNVMSTPWRGHNVMTLLTGTTVSTW